jgi:chitin synthase
MGLISVIMVLMAGVGFLTFGFTKSVCGTPANRFHGGAIGTEFIGEGSVTINGWDYDLSTFDHPAVGAFTGSTNPLFEGGWGAAGNDLSFLFQKTNEKCYGLITRAGSSSIGGSGDTLDWYFPCNIFSQYGNSAVNFTGYDQSTNCHATSKAKSAFSQLTPQGQVYLTWDDVSKSGRNLAVYES